MSRCTKLDDCVAVIADGQHSIGPEVCAFSDKRQIYLDGVKAIPYSCENERLRPHRFCAACLPLMGERTSHEGDKLPGGRIWQDPGRADAVQHALKAALNTSAAPVCAECSSSPAADRPPAAGADSSEGLPV